MECAVTLIHQNGILLSAFADSIYSALKLGRGKYQNIFIHGPANSGKTFILSVYDTFCNPATGTFAWVGAEKAEVIMLNDFCWNPSMIAWADFLQLLEGDIVHLPAPKNICSEDRIHQRHTIICNGRCTYGTSKGWFYRSRKHRNGPSPMASFQFLEADSTKRTNSFNSLQKIGLGQ